MTKKEEHLTKLVQTVKAKKFVNQYYKEKGVMPALSLVKSAKELTDDELANIQHTMEVDNLVEMAGDFEGGSIVVPGENISSLDIPADNAIKKVQASFASEAAINFSSPKSVGVVNLNNEGVIETLTVNAPATSAITTITVSANCGTIIATNANVTVPAPYTVEKIVLVTEEGDTNDIIVRANFAENANISTETSNPISIYNKNSEENIPNLSLDAENATVTLYNKWNEVKAAVSENTLKINGKGHINKLTLVKGNAVVSVAREADIEKVVANKELAAGTSITYAKFDITNKNSKELGGVGEMTLVENITRSSSLVSPVLPDWDAVWNLNGKTLEVTGTPKYGVYLNKYSSNLEVNGEGTIRAEGTYGLWNNTTTGKIVINGGNIEAQTHAVYAEKGEIEINGGTFKLTNADTAERDANGNLKFLINCLDANYKAGKANIIVKGGKFYEFDPANNEAEGADTSFVAEGYHSVMSEEEGKKVYTVVKD